MIKLIGVALIAAGFALRVNTLLVVLAAGLATGFAAGFSLNEIMAMIGKYFSDNRAMTLPIVLMLPVVGLLERYGLKERAEVLIRRSKAATAGRVILLYTAVRQISISLGVSIGGHAGAVRPLVAPMAEAAARGRGGELSAASVVQIRAHAAAGENIGGVFRRRSSLSQRCGGGVGCWIGASSGRPRLRQTREVPDENHHRGSLLRGGGLVFVCVGGSDRS